MMLNMIMHIPINEGRDRINVACPRVVSMVQNIVFEGGMLKYACEDEMPSSLMVRNQVRGFGLGLESRFNATLLLCMARRRTSLVMGCSSEETRRS